LDDEVEVPMESLVKNDVKKELGLLLDRGNLSDLEDYL
jgi:hypothetical protein